MKLSVIVIEYHCMEDVRNCVRSVDKHLSDIDLEYIVLSNSEYSEEELASHQKALGDVRLIRAHRNLGYAGGVNLALGEATGGYVYIINPDCLLTDGNAREILEEMDKCPDWAMTGPKVVNEQGEVQPSSRCFPRPWTFLLVRSVFSRLPGAGREKDRYLMRDYDRKTPRAVDWVSGGAVIVKMAALSQIGGMDERYFMYMEDVDWCRATWESGFKVVYYPSSRVIHAGMHQSIKGGLKALMNPHLQWHISSLFKYFRKYKWRSGLDTDFYRQTMSAAPDIEKSAVVD